MLILGFALLACVILADLFLAAFGPGTQL